MSASREKKARQANPTTGEKKRLAQEQQAAASAKNRLYAVIGVVIAIAAAALIVWDSGILQRNATAVAINGVNYTAAEVDYYYNATKNQFITTAETYAQYGLDTGYDTTLTPAEQIFSINEETGETITYEDYFRQNALETMRNVVALNSAAAAEGYTLSEEGKASVEAQRLSLSQAAAQYGTTVDTILKANYGSLITKDLYTKHTEMAILASEYSALYEEGIEFTDSELNTYYEEHKDELDSFDYNYAFISGTPETKTDADGKTIEATEEEKTAAMADAKKRATDLVAAVMAGADFDAVAKDYVAESSKEYYEAAGYTDRIGALGSNLSTLYSDWMTDPARKAGDISTFESDGVGYAVILFGDRYLSDSASVDIRHLLVAPKSDTEGATEYTAEQWAAAEAKAKDLLTQFTVGADTSAEAFGKLAEEHSDDARNADGTLYTSGGLYTGVTEGQMVDEFNDWIFDASRTAGQTGLVKTEYGWHVMYFVSRNDIVWQATAKSALLSDAMNEWIDELVEVYGAVA